MSYATYNYYMEQYLGTVIPEEDFARLALRASEFIDYYTAGRAAKATDAAVKELLAKACCAVAEQEAILATADQADHAGLKSESVGSWRADYRSASELQSLARTTKAKAAAQYLMPTGLLFRGVV